MRWAGVGAAIIAAAVDVLYLGVASSDAQFLRVPFVAGFIALMAICAALSTRASATRWRPLLLGIAAAGLLLLGVIGIFSIGLPLLAAGVLALLALINALRPSTLSPGTSGRAVGGMVAGGAILAVAALLAGFSLAEVVIRCPATGVESGGGTRLLGGLLFVQLRQRQADHLALARGPQNLSPRFSALERGPYCDRARGAV